MAIKSKARHNLTLRSIKREIAAGRDVAFWLDKAYTHLDSGTPARGTRERAALRRPSSGCTA